MFSKLLINPITKRQIERFLKKPANLMLYGSVGSGKRTVAEIIASAILTACDPQKLTSYPYYLQIKKEAGKQEISIDAVRQVIEFMTLKTPGKAGTRRIILIEDTQTMSQEAQNALLKILEEPHQDTIFILTADSARSVLPTVASRAQRIEVRPVSLSQSLKFYNQRYSASQIESAWRLSQGTAGLMTAILDKDKRHPLKSAVNSVKVLLKLGRYERFLQLEGTLKNKDDLDLFLEAFNRVITSLHHSAVKSGKHNLAIDLLKDRKLIKKLKKSADSNVSLRLIGLNLILKLNI